MKPDIPAFSIERSRKLWGTCLVALAVHALLLIPFLVSPSNGISLPRGNIEVTIASPDSRDTPDQASFESLADQLGGGSNDALERLKSAELGRDRQSDAIDPTNRQGQDTGQSDQSSAGVLAAQGQQDMTITPGELFLLKNQTLNDLKTGESEQRTLAELDLQTEQLRGLGDSDSEAVATIKSSTAAYINRWRQRIETIGTQRSQQTRLLTGEVELWSSIDQSGALLDYRVIRSSGDPKVDQAAKDILLQSAPFDPFPATMRAQHPSIEIVRIWQFRLGSPTLRP